MQQACFPALRRDILRTMNVFYGFAILMFAG